MITLWEWVQKGLMLFVKYVPQLAIIFIISMILLVLKLNWHTPDTKYSDSELEELRIGVQERALSYGAENTDNLRITPRGYSIYDTGGGLVSQTKVVNINKVTPEDYRDLNRQIYEVASYYMSKAYNMPYELREPLLLGAIALVETGVYADINKLYIPAIPTYGLTEVTTTTVDTYGAEETIANSDYWSRLLPYSIKHQGPLQMGINYGVMLAIAPDELQGIENNDGLVERYGSMYSNVPFDWIIPKYLDSGDRFNWRDACNRTVGVINTWYTYVPEITNKYEFMALVGMAHNVGQTVIVSPDYTNPEVSYFPWNNAGDARAFAKALSNDYTIEAIRSTAEKDIKDWRLGFISRPDIYRNQDWGYSLVSEMEIDSLYRLTGDYKNRLSYPIKILYYYFLLEYLYSGM